VTESVEAVEGAAFVLRQACRWPAAEGAREV